MNIGGEINSEEEIRCLILQMISMTVMLVLITVMESKYCQIHIYLNKKELLKMRKTSDLIKIIFIFLIATNIFHHT